MSSDDRLEQLVSSYRTLRDQGRSASAADLCRDCPDLTEGLQKRINEIESAPTLLPTKDPPSPPTSGSVGPA